MGSREHFYVLNIVFANPADLIWLSGNVRRSNQIRKEEMKNVYYYA